MNDPMSQWLNTSGILPWLRAMYEANPVAFLVVCGIAGFLILQLMFHEESPEAAAPASRKGKDHDSGYY